jgi:hypothetical protein
VFSALSQFDRARDFARVDAGSEWSSNVEVHILLRQGNTQAALDALRRLPDSGFFHTRALQACYSKPRPSGSDQLFTQAEKDVAGFKDPEPRFATGVNYNACLGNAFSARLLKSAIASGFCGYENLQFDPLLANFRKSPEYPAVLAQAKQCQDQFLAQRGRSQN